AEGAVVDGASVVTGGASFSTTSAFSSVAFSSRLYRKMFVSIMSFPAPPALPLAAPKKYVRQLILRRQQYFFGPPHRPRPSCCREPTQARECPPAAPPSRRQRRRCRWRPRPPVPPGTPPPPYTAALPHSRLPCRLSASACYRPSSGSAPARAGPRPPKLYAGALARSTTGHTIRDAGPVRLKPSAILAAPLTAAFIQRQSPAHWVAFPAPDKKQPTHPQARESCRLPSHVTRCSCSVRGTRKRLLVSLSLLSHTANKLSSFAYSKALKP
ncbi:hypothetical protein TraAM80_09458, partial [Trypanosoma rangeli]